MAEEFVKSITKKSQDFSTWYNDVVLKAELADYAPVRGCMVIRPYGYALWERIQAEMDRMIKDAGISNAYFPLFIPESFLKKEKEHVEGFSPELAVVTIGGGEKLAEPLVIRPTSETVMYAMFAKWISSWRDLPFKLNQWCNIVRWEKRTYLFLRTTEFLWQEGHTAHVTHEEALEEVFRALKAYQTLYQDFLALAGYSGVKSQKEKFAGAVNTYTYEMLMPDGKILQGCTSHDLGQNFSRPFKVMFRDKDGKQKYVWQTSWGLATRSIGGLVMEHGDDRGLILPPKVAPIQVVIVPIPAVEATKNLAIAKLCGEIKHELEGANLRVKLDSREEQTPGWKFNDWELKGVPIRLEIGQRELKQKTAVLVRRDTGQKAEFKIDPPAGEAGNLKLKIAETLNDIQRSLLVSSESFLEENTHKVDDYDELKEIMKGKKGFISAFWCEDRKCEDKIKEETKATVRCLPLGAKKEKGKCVYCGREASFRWLFGQAY